MALTAAKLLRLAEDGATVIVANHLRAWEIDAIDDPADLDARDATEGDCRFVNDHGNVTVYAPANDGQEWVVVLELV